MQTHKVCCSSKRISALTVISNIDFDSPSEAKRPTPCLVKCQRYQKNSESLSGLFSESKISLRLIMKQPWGRARWRLKTTSSAKKRRPQTRSSSHPGSAFTLNLWISQNTWMGSERAALLESIAHWSVFAFGERTLTYWPRSNQMVPYNSTGPPWSRRNSLAGETPLSTYWQGRKRK